MTEGTRPARVVLVSGKDPLEDSGGHGTYARMWARAAVAAGYAPVVFCVSHSAGVVETPFGRLHRIPSPLRHFPDRHRVGLRSHTAGLHLGPLTRAVVRHAGSSSDDAPILLHGFQVWAAAAVRAAASLRRRGVGAAAIMTAYTTMEHEILARWNGLAARGVLRARIGLLWELAALRACVSPNEGRACRGADRILVNYESVRRLVSERWPGCAPIERVPYTTEAAFLEDGVAAPAGSEGPGAAEPPELSALSPAGAPVVLAVSRHDARKGLGTLLRALASLRGDGVPFRAALVGGGPLLTPHRRLARELGLDRAVAIPGYVADTRPFWRAAAVFALPSDEEGSGSLSLLEALQRGRAAVCTNVDGLPEDVDDGRSALLVPPRDPGALAGALRRLLADASLRGALAAGARARFMERFRPESVVRAVRQVYAAARAEPAPSAPLAARAIRA
jgi:glycosyltransferase involved in cell wall biosynthesis